MKIERLSNNSPRKEDYNNPLIMDRFEERQKINQLCYYVETLGNILEKISKSIDSPILESDK